MRKVLLALIAGAIMLMPATAGADIPFNPGNIDLPQVQLKVDICHNGTIVPVSVNAAAVIDTGHGLFDTTTHLFTARVDVPGHSTDTVLRYYSKIGNLELALYVNPNQSCDKDEEETPPFTPVHLCYRGVDVIATDQAELDAYLAADAVRGECPEEETTTTTAPVVTTTTQPVVTTTTAAPAPEVPAVNVPTQSVSNQPSAAPEAAPAASPTGDLPRTGSGETVLLTFAGLMAIVLGFMLRFLSRNAN
jgi:LPXTG-motif cell wall-anchored protein